MFEFPPEQQYSMERSIAPIAVYQFINKRVKTLLLSAGFMEMFGFSTYEEGYHVMDNDMYRDAHPDDVPRIANEALRFARNEIPVYKVIYRSKLNGEYHIIHAQGKHVTMPSGERLAFVWYFDEGLYSEIFGNQGDFDLRYNRILKASSDSKTQYDYLTGMPVMSYFVDLAAEGNRETRKNGHKPVMLFFDICGIRDFNRRYGFEEGDNLIKALSRLLVSQFSNENCSRFGHDQFVVYTDECDIEQRVNNVLLKCDNLIDGVNAIIRAGIYVYGEEIINPRVACDRAKIACDAARGRMSHSFHYFDDTMRKQIETNQYILDYFDRALSENWIKVYYQPIVRTANGRVCDEEALSRWQDPVRGSLMPDEYIPVLEKSNKIYKLDLFVVEQILKKIKAQIDEGLYVVPTSVNLSRTDFDSCDIVEEIRKRVDASGVGRDKITIEVTESTVSRDLDLMRKQIGRFQELGFKVWMDDFGRGHSSMDLLLDIHFDLIKFDMYFMQQFDKSPKSRIIITELIKMAMSLGIETVTEGVETEEQREFLKEAGCTKLQGFYYCKAISAEQIFDRYRKGIQIGFENPVESEYYTAIGNTNLYNLPGDKNDDFERGPYFNTLPIAIIETDGTELTYLRYNSSYRNFRKLIGHEIKPGEENRYLMETYGPVFIRTMRQCMNDGLRQLAKERLQSGVIINFMVRRIAVNPITNRTSIVLTILDYTDFSRVSFDSEEKIPTDSFVYALSEDYTFLYYIDLDTDHYVEYIPDEKSGELTVVRHGVDFFGDSRKDTMTMVYKDDIPKVLTEFTKKNVIATLNNNHSFSLTYRLNTENGPTYVGMKASRMGNVGNRIIIGVNNVEEQMKAAEAYERVKEEKITYSRITALAGNYICIYTVDPDTDHYVEYSVTKDYENLGLAKRGDDFFKASIENGIKHIFPEDYDKFRSLMNKENVMNNIRRTGLFAFDYRLLIKGEPKYVSLRAAIVKESDGPRLIIGISDIDEQVKRDQEYAYNLHLAKLRADVDALTGVRNKHAYIDFEEKINSMISEEEDLRFAITVFDVDNLKEVNDRSGHKEGDRFLKKATEMICNSFKHSPVFRVGGDEFVAFSRGHDYENLDRILKSFGELNASHEKNGDVVVSFGMARFNGEKDIADVFDKADKSMYVNKEQYKRKI